MKKMSFLTLIYVQKEVRETRLPPLYDTNMESAFLQWEAKFPSEAKHTNPPAPARFKNFHCDAED